MNYELRIIVNSAFIFAAISFFNIYAFAQAKIAVITPEKTFQSQTYREKLRVALSSDFKIINDSLSETIFNAAAYENPYNLSLAEAKNTGAAIGCDYFALVKSEILRRYSFEKKEYYESYAAVYVVSARTGRLVDWKLVKGEAVEARKSEKVLYDSVNDTAREISAKLKSVGEQELSEKPPLKLEENPAAGSNAAENFRPPLPYQRISPKYTMLANLYGIAATVDIEIDVDETGRITRSEIVRWAGYGLDESVAETVRRMNWRAASRAGQPLPLRVLLRYNFKKIEADEEQ